MKEKLYPERTKCKKCRKTLNSVVIDGLYDSYTCAGLPAPENNVEKAPRHCKRMIDNRWGWKTKYRSADEVPVHLSSDPATNIYVCDNCHFLHVGHSKVQSYKPEKLKRSVWDMKTLGSVLQRRREQRNLDKKFVASKIKTSVIRITEIENGSPASDVKTLFNLIHFLHLNVEITEKE